MSEFEWLGMFADNLNSLLREAHMSQRELAAAAGLSEGAVSCYTRGIKMPGPRAIVNMAYALDCSFDDLMDFGEMIR